MSLDPERNTRKHYGKHSWEKVSADAYFFAAIAAKQLQLLWLRPRTSFKN
jgi:hypothetical protein